MSEAADAQLRRVVSESLVSALQTQPFGFIRVLQVGGGEQLARAVDADHDVSVQWVDNGDDLSRHGSQHVVIVLLPRVAASERVALLRAAHRAVRPAGILVVVATVVAVRGEHRDLVPSMSVLIEELNSASGLALHIDDLRSVRWHSEPYIRGVIVSCTSLRVGKHK